MIIFGFIGTKNWIKGHVRLIFTPTVLYLSKLDLSLQKGSSHDSESILITYFLKNTKETYFMHFSVSHLTVTFRSTMKPYVMKHLLGNYIPTFFVSRHGIFIVTICSYVFNLLRLKLEALDYPASTSSLLVQNGHCHYMVYWK